MGQLPERAQVNAPSAPPPCAAALGSVAPLDEDGPDTPRCLRCEYLLIGLSGERCPECGTAIDWTRAKYAGRHPGLPLDRARGMGRVWAGSITFLMVLFRPLKFARQISEFSSVWPATVFAAVAIAVGFVGNFAFGPSGPYPLWFVGIWAHVELQSLVFWLADFRPGHALRRWSFWRKVSLYTTAFVALDWAGPPAIEEYFRGWTFPWILDKDMWARLLGTPPQYPSLNETLCGIVFYWWMAVLTIVLWVRLRRKWMLLFILAALPGVTLASCWVAVQLYDWTSVHE